MAKNKITTGEGFVTFEWGDGSRTISVNPNFVYVSLFEDTLSFTLVGVPRPTGLSLFTTRYDDFELNGSTFGSADEALEAILEAFEAAGASFRWIIVDELPATGQSNVMYLLRIPNPELGNIFEEYIWVENAWELVGSNGGSSIRTIYVGTSADSVDSGTCIINKVEGKKDWLNIVYADSDGYCNMTKINLNEFIIEGEFASGVTSLADGTVVGVVDPRQTKVVISYDESGNPVTSGDVLSVNVSGFTVDRIQDAINAKVLIDRRLYTPKEGEYNKANQEITFKSDLNDELFVVDLSGDTELNSGSTNFVENSAITKAFEDVQDNIISSTTYVASSHTIEYNNRKDVKLFETVLDVDNDLDSGSTNPVVNSAVTEAINDLEERKADWVSAVTSGDVVTTDDKNVLEFYNRSGATIFDIELPNILVDEHLSSGSSNPVANSAITEAIEDLEERKADWLSATTSGVVITATSGNTLEYFNRSGDTLFKIELPVADAVKGDENTIHAEINPQNEKVVSSLVYIKKITTGLPETVKERYQLVGADGNPYTTASGDTSASVDIYKDSHIVSITYITDSGDTHYQNLEYKYIDASGDTQTEYVDISELVLEVEIGDGLEVQNHIVKGKIDPASEKVVTEYTTAGTSAQTEEVLTVGKDGFKASNIQLAIDTKAEVNHKLYDVVNGVYEASSHTITFVSENDDLFDTELTFDNALNSGSTNAVQNKVVKEEIEKRQIKNVELTQDEYDALVSAGTVDEETLYIISDAEPIDTSKYVTSASITSNTSAYTISFSGESGELFDVEFNKGGGLPLMEGTDIKIVSGDSYDTIYVSADTVIDSASTRVVQSKAIAEALDTKLDKVNFLNKIYPKGSIYITESNTNPSTFIGGTWELIGGEDADKNYYPAFAISTDTAGTTIDESLPNIKGAISSRAGYGASAYWQNSGVYHRIDGNYSSEDSDGTSKRGTVNFSAQYGQTNADGTTYVPATASTYQDGAQVNVNSIKLFFWKRTDDAPIAMMLETITLERGEDVLWSGNTGSGTITLNAPIDDYDTIEFTIAAEGDWWQTFVTTPQILNTMTGNFMMAATWSSYDRFVSLSKPTGGTQFTVGSTHAALRLVRGIKDAYVSRTDITTEINSGSTDDKAASAKAVYDAFAGIEFIDKSVTVNGGGTGSFTGTITCNADEVPLGRGATVIQVNGAVGYGWVDRIAKNSDTSYTFSGWRNANGGSSITILAVFVKMPTRYLNQ